MSFLKKSASTFVSQIFLMIFGMTSGVITARVLGPELKGQAALLTMIPQILFMVGGLGLGSAFSFYVAKRKYPPRQVLTWALVSALTFGFLVVGAFYFTLPLHASVWEGIPPRLILYVVLLTVVSIYVAYLARIVVGYGRIYSMNMGDLARSFTSFTSIVLLLLVWNYGLDGVIASLWLGTLAQAVVLLYVLRADLLPESFWGSGLVRDSFGYGIKSHALLLINFLNYRLDLLLLSYFTDATEVGFYSLAVGMAELMWLVPNAAVAPLFSGVAASDAADKSLITLRTVRWSLIFLSILALCGILFGRLFIRLLYGADFLPSYPPFLWLLPGICLFPLFKLLVVDLAARGKPGFGTISSAAALVINIVANIILIPRMGAKGAALATSFSYICMSLLSLLFFLHVTKYRIRDVFRIDAEELAVISRVVSRFSYRLRSGGKG